MERMLATAANATAASGHGSTCHPGNLACDPTQGGIFLFLALAAGVFSRTVLSVTGLPYTVILLIIGGLVGGLDLWMEYVAAVSADCLSLSVCTHVCCVYRVYMCVANRLNWLCCGALSLCLSALAPCQTLLASGPRWTLT